MKFRVSPKHKGARVNVREAASGKANKNIVRTVNDGAIIEGEKTRGKYVKVDGGYILAELLKPVD